MSYQSKHTGVAIDASVDTTQQILNLIYPIGAVYISVNDVNPANFIGGTWERIQDRFLVAAGDSYEAGTTGGTANHTHTTAGHTLTINEMPSHSHTLVRQQWYSTDIVSSAMAGSIYSWKSGTGEGGNTSYSWRRPDGVLDIGYTAGNASHSHGNTGSSSNLPPYLSVYMWKRTA